MNKALYPLKFEPIFSDRPRGGTQVREVFNKTGASDTCGESREISGVSDNVSVVANGWLAGKNLEEIIGLYKGSLVGKSVYERFGNVFPLLVKFIAANDDLSIQVHPDDEMALARHNLFGKTEMWYILHAEKDAQLIVGFNRDLSKDEYLHHLHNISLPEILNYESVGTGDVYFIPPRTVHAIKSGVQLVEIQQTSDLTYRIYDYDRVDALGNRRDLHTDWALDVLDFKHYNQYKTDYKPEYNTSVEIVRCEYFTTSIIEGNERLERDYRTLDSFVIYICIKGEVVLKCGNVSEKVVVGETVLIPASIDLVVIEPLSDYKILEVGVG